MKKISGFVAFIIIAAATSLATTGCGFSHSTTVTSPTSVGATAAAATPTTSTSTPASSTSGSLVGSWTAPAATTATLPAVGTCSNFQFQITTQTASAISGTFGATCGGGITLTGTANGTVNGTSVSITATGNAALPGTSTCPFTLTGTGNVIDNGTTLNVPFTGTTCVGPVSGTEVLHKPASNSIDAPAPVSPSPNAIITSLRPTFIVTDATKSGTVGAITYTIEVANDFAFTNMYASWTAAEQAGQTTFSPPKDLAYTSVYFWHVRGTDGTTTGAWSQTLSFQVGNAPVQAPTPSGADGIDLRQVIVTGGSPTDVANWAVTAKITALDFASSGVDVEFTKKNGGDRWPDVVPPGWDGSLQYTLWMVVNVNGQWYTSGGVEYWYGLGRSGGQPSRFTSNWYYSPAVWGPLATHQPTPGEQVGFFVTAGDARVKDVRSVVERSNVVMVPFPSDGGAYYPF
jgi:hypothetical protein